MNNSNTKSAGHWPLLKVAQMLGVHVALICLQGSSSKGHVMFCPTHLWQNNSIVTLGDYIVFIGNIPMITNILGVRHLSSLCIYIIKFLMSMDAFEKYYACNYLHVDGAIIFCDF